MEDVTFNIGDKFKLEYSPSLKDLNMSFEIRGIVDDNIVIRRDNNRYTVETKEWFNIATERGFLIKV